MRIPEKQSKRRVTAKRAAIIVVSAVLLALVWARLQALGRQTVASDEVLVIAVAERANLIREVRSPGTLVPIELSFLSASSSGRVDEILLEAGDVVDAGTIIMVLENPELAQSVDAAKYDLEVQRAAYRALEQRTRQEILRQRIVVADFKSRYEIARLRRKANEELLQTAAVSTISYNEAVLLEEQLRLQYGLEVERVESLPALRQAELAAAQARIDKSLRQLTLQQLLLDDLHVKSNASGVLQEIMLEEGEQVTPGSVLARIAGQDDLKAELRVQESQVKDVAEGQPVVLSAGGKTAGGQVRRIDPAVQQGVVVVDVHFTGDMLAGARPDLRVEGVIELERLEDVLTLKRPVFTREFSSSSLFVVDQDQAMARRRQVEFGRASVNAIEVLSNLEEGDRVVISDMKKYGDLSQISLR